MRFLKGKFYADDTPPNGPVVKGIWGYDCDDVNMEDWAVLGCNELQLGCTKIYWAVLDCNWLYRAVLGCTGHFWAILDCTGLYWTLLDCIGLHKKQSSFLRPTHLNLAVSIRKDAKCQKSDFYLKIDQVQHRVFI